MTADVTVRITDIANVADAIEALRVQISDTRPVMDVMGAMVASAGQAAFTQQALGSIKWPRRYPFEPFVVNVAGLVADLAGPGGVPKARRFQARPAGFDTGSLEASIDHDVVSDTEVEVGSPLEYADKVNRGGKGTQEITGQVRSNLAAFFRNDPRATKPVKARLGFLFQDQTLETEVVPRPFLGIPDETEADMIETVEEMLAGEPG